VPTFDEVFLSSLNEIKKSHENALLGGSIKSMEEYKQLCGFIRGVNTAVLEYKKISSSVDDDSLL